MRSRLPVTAPPRLERDLVYGAVVGFCLCELGAGVTEPVGRVAELGVVPAHRGTGLGVAPLYDGFRALKGRGATRIALDVDAENTTSALRRYERAGMTPRPAFTIWETGPGSAVPRRP